MEDKPMFANPESALDALFGANTNVEFKGGKLRCTIYSHAILSKLNLFVPSNLVDVICWTYALFDDGDDNRCFKVFEHAQKGKEHFEQVAMKWAKEVNICAEDYATLIDFLNKAMTAILESSTEYKRKGDVGGNDQAVVVQP